MCQLTMQLSAHASLVKSLVSLNFLFPCVFLFVVFISELAVQLGRRSCFVMRCSKLEEQNGSWQGALFLVAEMEQNFLPLSPGFSFCWGEVWPIYSLYKVFRAADIVSCHKFHATCEEPHHFQCCSPSLCCKPRNSRHHWCCHRFGIGFGSFTANITRCQSKRPDGEVSCCIFTGHAANCCAKPCMRSGAQRC